MLGIPLFLETSIFSIVLRMHFFVTEPGSVDCRKKSLKKNIIINFSEHEGAAGVGLEFSKISFLYVSSQFVPANTFQCRSKCWLASKAKQENLPVAPQQQS